MLAALALDANHPVPLSTLTQAIWADAPPASAIANLRTYAAALRRSLGDRLIPRPKAYEIRLEHSELDSNEFLRLAATGRATNNAGDPSRAATHLEAALNLWRGPAGGGLPCGPALQTRLATLDQQRLDVFEDYVQAMINTGDYRHLATQLRGHLTHHPARERAWEQLMLVQYRTGNITGALTAYPQARAALRQHLGIDPGPTLTNLHQAMLNRDPTLEPSHPAPIQAPLLN